MTAAPASRPLSPPRAVGWAILFLVAGFVLMVALYAVGAFLAGGLRGQQGARLILLQSAAGLLAFGLLTWGLGYRYLGLSLAELRYAVPGGARSGFGLGLLLGWAPAALALGLSLSVGGARLLDDSGTAGQYAGSVLRTTLLLAPAALLEEVMFRGVSQVLLARAVGRGPAVLALSGLFALAHVFNPNTTALGLLNIGLAGVFLGAAFYTPGGLWAAWGAHLGWNATLAALDAPVSGLPFPIPLINYEPGGPAWLTGGTFGPEGGLLATVAIVLAILAAWRWSRKEQFA